MLPSLCPTVRFDRNEAKRTLRVESFGESSSRSMGLCWDPHLAGLDCMARLKATEAACEVMGCRLLGGCSLFRRRLCSESPMLEGARVGSCGVCAAAVRSLWVLNPPWCGRLGSDCGKLAATFVGNVAPDDLDLLDFDDLAARWVCLFFG